VERPHVSDKAHGKSPFGQNFNFELEKKKNDMFLIRHMENIGLSSLEDEFCDLFVETLYSLKRKTHR